MARSIRSKRGMELRRIQREKLANWDKNRIQKLSNALAKTSEHVQYITPEGNTNTLSDTQQQALVEKLDTVAMEISDGKDASETVESPTKDLTLNQIIKKTGIPKRKKRNAGRYGRKKKNKGSKQPKKVK
eukprot:CAMPEP_0117031346 /NCGR_PEP_ID=MMETSP0472-20121206/22543_1 /TAXON_ID=693140 ORGANISM="Tiarina fusus, Strain LIS" /NCGR_SAMPLE_ID=MMETSP0472 /ASSEMBLY_ACC=CAM_ASM_000603 /LENGTH=129 /DNA_ID=CAMNT_0004739657 /DNA_START=17 /DNA_END=406 /DNA_ORIENTATION=+